MKRITAFLLSLMIASTFTACADKDTAKPEDSGVSSSKADTTTSQGSDNVEATVEDSTASEEQSKEEAASSNEADSSVAEASQLAETSFPEVEPIVIPEEGWTEESIEEVLCINGQPISLPCKFADFGEGFELNIEEYASLRDHHAFVCLNYNGAAIGSLGIENCADLEPNSLNKGDIVSIILDTDILEDGSYNRAPISINGISLGSSIEDVESQLGFEVKNDSDSSNDLIGDYHVQMTYENNCIKAIMITHPINIETEN